MVPKPADADTGEGKRGRADVGSIKLTHLLPMGTPSIPPNGPRAASSHTTHPCRLTQPSISSPEVLFHRREGIGGVWRRGWGQGDQWLDPEGSETGVVSLSSLGQRGSRL